MSSGKSTKFFRIERSEAAFISGETAEQRVRERDAIAMRACRTHSVTPHTWATRHLQDWLSASGQ